MTSGELHEPAAGGGRHARRRPEDTGERRLAGYQRALRWIAWLTFLGLAVWNSQRVYFSGWEWLALAAAIGVSIWCLARPLGGPKVSLSKPSHLIGEFESRTSWGLVLFGAILTVGGVAATGAAVYDVVTGRATVGDVFRDIAVFVEGWFVELFAGGMVDAELENTHAYALFVLLLPGLLLLWLNLEPFLERGTRFRVEADGSVSVRARDRWEPLLEYRFPTVTADGTTIAFHPPPDGGAGLELPQLRVFSREYGVRLPAQVSAEFFGELLAGRGFTVDGVTGDSFTAHRTA